MLDHLKTGEEWETVVYDPDPRPRTDPPSVVTQSPHIGIRQVWLPSVEHTKVALKRGDRIKCRTDKQPDGSLIHSCVSECLEEDDTYKQIKQFWWGEYPAGNPIPKGWVPADGVQNSVERGGTGKNTRRDWLSEHQYDDDGNVVFATHSKIVIQRIK